MLITIDPGSSDPVFVQIADQVREQLVGGDIPVGTRLPAARDLAEHLGVNLHTVLHAYQSLRDEGVIALRRGSGAVAISPDRDLGAIRAAIAEIVREAKDIDLALPTLTAMIRAEFGR
jgi:GntR family transcriptional regulator